MTNTEARVTDIVVNLNSVEMFTAHRLGCADLRKAERSGLSIIRSVEPTPAAIRRWAAGPMATEDDYSVSERHIRRAPCLR